MRDLLEMAAACEKRDSGMDGDYFLSLASFRLGGFPATIL